MKLLKIIGIGIAGLIGINLLKANNKPDNQPNDDQEPSTPTNQLNQEQATPRDYKEGITVPVKRRKVRQRHCVHGRPQPAPWPWHSVLV